MHTCLAMRLLCDALGSEPVLLGRDAVGGSEGLGEVGSAGEAPAGSDGVDRCSAKSRVGEVAADVLQALMAYAGGDRFPFMLEETMQVAGGDVVRGSDGVRGQVRVVSGGSGRRHGCAGQGFGGGFPA